MDAPPSSPRLGAVSSLRAKDSFGRGVARDRVAVQALVGEADPGRSLRRDLASQKRAELVSALPRIRRRVSESRAWIAADLFSRLIGTYPQIKDK